MVEFLINGSWYRHVGSGEGVEAFAKVEGDGPETVEMTWDEWAAGLESHEIGVRPTH